MTRDETLGNFRGILNEQCGNKSTARKARADADSAPGARFSRPVDVSALLHFPPHALFRIEKGSADGHATFRAHCG
jgi:hypothetical protein